MLKCLLFVFDAPAVNHFPLTCRNIVKLSAWILGLIIAKGTDRLLGNSTSCKKVGQILICCLRVLCFLILLCYIYLSSSEPDVETTLDKMFDELAFKQNDSEWNLQMTFNLILQLMCN